MTDLRRLDDFVRRLAAAVRAAGLYAGTHPIVERSMEALHGALEGELHDTRSLAVAFVGNDIVVGRTRLRGTAAFAGVVRHFRERRIEKVTLSKELGRKGLRAFVSAMADRDAATAVERLEALHLKGLAVGTLNTDDAPMGQMGLAAARRAYGMAVSSAQMLWGEAASEEAPDPEVAHLIIDAMARAVNQDKTSILALTALKAHDDYTFTHMVNVSLLTMAQARTLGISGPLLREFGLAGLMHDIGKVKVPQDIINKPGRLNADETRIMQRHVVDGAQILRHTPDMPALAPIVAFEHHLKHDLSGYPEHAGARRVNLCTMLVSIADVFDALRTKRPYRDALPAARVRKMLAELSGTSFEPTLLRRFITLVGMFPVGTGVRLKTGEVGIVTDVHATDAFRPKVRLVRDAAGNPIPGEQIVDTADHDEQGRHPYSVLEAADTDSIGVDPLKVLPS